MSRTVDQLPTGKNKPNVDFHIHVPGDLARAVRREATYRKETLSRFITKGLSLYILALSVHKEGGAVFLVDAEGRSTRIDLR